MLPSAMPAGTASIAISIIFSPPLFSLSLGEETKERTDRTNFNQLALPSRREVIQTKSRKIWCLILADVLVAYAAARFWEGGAGRFVGGSFG